MLKICHLITSLDVGGAEISLLRLLSAIDTTRYQFSVISLIEPGRVGKRIESLGIPVRSLGMTRGWASPAGLLRSTRWLLRDKPDILMTWLYHADLLGLAAGRLASVRSIVWNLRASDMDMSRYRRLSGWTLRMCSRLSHLPDAVVVNSERGKAFHAGIGFHPDRWELIRNGVDQAQFRPDAKARTDVRRELGLGPDQLLIGLLARLDPMKDHDNFMAAACQVAQAGNPVHFVLAGEGADSHSMKLATHLAQPPLAGRVHLLGERDDIARLTAALDIACSSSRSEGFPNTLAEAMSCGVVCVATDAGDSAEIIGETGIIVPVRDAGALAQGLLRAIRMGHPGRNALGLAARERVMQHFSLERCVRRYEHLFTGLIEQPSKADAPSR